MNLKAFVALMKARVGETDLAVVALSGGVDSGLAAFGAYRALGERAVAVTVVSELTPKRDLEQAVSVARHIGIRHHRIEIDILQSPQVRTNGPDRCYHCKRAIFQAMEETFGPECVFIDGTNADDDTSRPGLRAIKEYSVFSPLCEAGMGKATVLSMARKVGLPNWDAPSGSCLATRIAHGVELTSDGLQQVETVESYCHSLGVDTLRVRLDNLVAIVEHLPQYTNILNKNRDKVVALAHRIGLRSCEFKEWTE